MKHEVVLKTAEFTIYKGVSYEMLIDDTICTIFKAHAEGDEGKYVVIAEDAFGDRVMNCHDEAFMKRYFADILALFKNETTS